MFNNVDVPLVQARRLPNPGAGLDWAITAPGHGIWRVSALSALFTASVAVANRIPTLRVVTSDGVVAAAPAGAAITAGLSVTLSSFPGAGPTGAAAGPQLWATSDEGWLLLPGWSLSPLTAGIDVADQWSNISFALTEYPTGPNVRITPDVTAFTEPAR